MKKSSRRTAKIGIMQVTADFDWTVEQCQRQVLRLAEECFKEGADIVFMPEGFQYKTACNTNSPKELAEKYSDDFKAKCSELALRYGAYFVPWDYELAEGTVYNTSYILDRHGKEIGRYRKVHPTYPETIIGISAGKDFPVFDLDFGKIGIMICFDNYFAESAKILSLKGAELILFPLFGDTLKGQWEIKLKARAIDNSVYVAPCHILSCLENNVSYTGIVGPSGELVCKLETEDTCKVVEIDMGKKVITNCSAAKGKYEDIKQYLLKTRNTRAYEPLLKGVGTPDWEDIMIEE